MKAEELQNTVPGSEVISTAKSGGKSEVAAVPGSQPVLSVEDSQTGL